MKMMKIFTNQMKYYKMNLNPSKKKIIIAKRIYIIILEMDMNDNLINYNTNNDKIDRLDKKF